MSMDCELLVHIKAPSAVRDDKRYISIAQSILDFQPAIITRVFGPDPSPPCSVSAEEVLHDNGISGTRLVSVNCD